MYEEIKSRGAIIVPVATSLYLFSGIYKGIFVNAILDWTVFWALVGLVGVYIFDKSVYRYNLGARVNWIFAVLLVYLLVRVSEWDTGSFGVYKIAESSFFGMPALIMGYCIGRHYEAFRVISLLLFGISIVISVYIIPIAIITQNITSTNPFLSGGYQLTGTMIGLGCLCAAFLLSGNSHLNWKVVSGFSICLLGLAVVGSVPAFVFTGLAILILVVFALQIRGLRSWGMNLFKAYSMGVAVIVLFSVTFQPPSAIYRLIWKLHVAEVEYESGSGDMLVQNQYESESINMWIQNHFGVKTLPADEHANYVDRFELAKFAFVSSAEAPWIGHGFGSFLYRGVRTPHNLILELLYEGGMIALAIFLAFNFVGLWTFLKVIIASGRHKMSKGVIVVIAIWFLLFLSQLVGGYFIGRLLMFSYGMLFGVRAFLSSTSDKPVEKH